MNKELGNMVFDLNCKVYVSIDYGGGTDFTAATIAFKNDKGKLIILNSINDTTPIGKEIIKELSNMGESAISTESSSLNQSNRKKLGDLTLREVIELKDKPCPELYCKECRKEHEAIHAICVANIAYDSEFLDLEQEVEIGDE